jgi:hypothetical protein
MWKYEYTVEGEIRYVCADGYSSDGDEIVFKQKWRDPVTGVTEREVLRIAADERSVLRLGRCT